MYDPPFEHEQQAWDAYKKALERVADTEQTLRGDPVTESRRVHLEGLTAGALQLAEYARLVDRDGPSRELCQHALQLGEAAGNPDTQFRALMVAVDTYDRPEFKALDLLQKAARIAESAPTRPSMDVELLARRGTALRRLGNAADAINDWNRMRVLLRETGMSTAVRTAAHHIAMALARYGEPTAGAVLLTTASHNNLWPALRCEFLLLRGSMLFHAGRPAAGARVLSSGLSLAATYALPSLSTIASEQLTWVRDAVPARIDQSLRRLDLWHALRRNGDSTAWREWTNAFYATPPHTRAAAALAPGGIIPAADDRIVIQAVRGSLNLLQSLVSETPSASSVAF